MPAINELQKKVAHLYREQEVRDDRIDDIIGNVAYLQDTIGPLEFDSFYKSQCEVSYYYL
jgi:hypothetical protein